MVLRVMLRTALVALLATAPPSFARPGRGFSIGSRGTHTYLAVPRTTATPFGAAPIGRTVTPPPRYGAVPAANRTRHPFAAAFGGGLLGFALATLVLGHGFGLLLPLGILLLLGFARRSRRAATARPGGLAPFARPSGGGHRGVPVGDADRRAFVDGLLAVQRAWTLDDRAALARLATPEMAGILADQLDDLARRGARNAVSDVRVQQAALAEAWREGASDYASVGFRFSSIDITTDLTGRVLDGSATEHVVATETWTFVRRANTPWLLSAIQNG